METFNRAVTPHKKGEAGLHRPADPTPDIGAGVSGLRQRYVDQDAFSARALGVMDWSRYARVIRDSLTISRPLDLFGWLQGELQYFLAHEVLIAAWGDFPSGEIRYDIVALPQIEAMPAATAGSEMTALLRRLHERWVTYRRMPYCINEHETDIERAGAIKPVRYTLSGMQSALVHGIQDERSQQDVLYVLMHSDREMPVNARKMLEILLPYIDNALRRVSPLPQQQKKLPGLKQAPICIGSLSGRESEILDWVRKGKTNHEIGMILGISAYTVKNHLQRIFRKLDVYNRAQAVGKFTLLDGTQHLHKMHD